MVIEIAAISGAVQKTWIDAYRADGWTVIPFDGSKTRQSQGPLALLTFFNPLRVLMLMILQWLLRPFGC